MNQLTHLAKNSTYLCPNAAAKGVNSISNQKISGMLQTVNVLYHDERLCK